MSDTFPEGYLAARLILQLRQSGISDPALLSAIETIPRSHFLPASLQDAAWDDVSLPIACGQTISRPMAIAGMVNALRPAPDLSVLEVGSGSGYQTAVLSKLFRRVFSLERYRTLVDFARERVRALELYNIEIMHSDGFQGWPLAAPFDRIILGGAVESLSDGLLAQLKPNGILVAPIGEGESQHVHALIGDGKGGFEDLVLSPSRFLLLQPGLARDL
jgi:protein-L-isoaspartate(D-aspartate) O-methyltransferase